MAANSHRTQHVEGFAAITQQIRSARLRAGWAVNREMLSLFWQLGRDILAREATESREGRPLEELAAHLRGAFSGSICFSGDNLERMRAFAKAWPDFAAVESLLMQLPWEQHLVLLSKRMTRKQRLAYAQRALERGWSSATLARHIRRRTTDAFVIRRGARFGNRSVPGRDSDGRGGARCRLRRNAAR
jgi:predicted nuclease of restriction endonuclease-like (RecB) superfamily